MKKLLFVFAALLFFSCDDGDFDVPSFDFENTITSCGEYILYIKNSGSTETMALILSSEDIPNSEGITELQITSERNVNYRIYSDAIGAEYFCQDIPPTNPQVIKELNAESGIIVITSSAVGDSFDHDISFTDLTFQDGQERIYFETFYFGVFEN